MNKFFTFVIVMILAYIADSILQEIPYGTKVAWVAIICYMIFSILKDFNKKGQVQ